MENSHIQWTDHTFNPWEGCTKVSPGCAHCYAEARNQRFAGGANWGKGAPRRRTSASNWKEPLKWNKAVVEGRKSKVESQRRPRVFCASLADWLDDEVPIEWLADLLKVIHDTPNLDWQLLTKRPENWRKRMDDAVNHLWRAEECLAPDYFAWAWAWFQAEEIPANIWLGTTVEDQPRADERIPELLKIPARVRFLSVEPMLEAIIFRRNLHEYNLELVDWAIFGGESGPKARPCNIEWIRNGVRQCRQASVPVFVKQLGACPTVTKAYPGQPMPDDFRTFTHTKGGDPAEWPEDLRVREFPALDSRPSTLDP